jgi:putative intracellular protease/amidase
MSTSVNWVPNVVVDGVLMTGQNPASAAPLAEKLSSVLKA